MGLRRVVAALNRLAEEPPFRLATRALVKYFSNSVRAKTRWDAVDRPEYLFGVLAAADEAKWLGTGEICVIEFGVAGGAGLLELQDYGAAVEGETGIKIWVFGFDTGEGLPDLCGDYRDHPDVWRRGDFPMDEARLRQRLAPQTQLVLGNVRDTVPKFVNEIQPAPVGFIAIDLDLYSSTRNALQVLSLPKRRMLTRVGLYFDDVNAHTRHRFAGERLAIEEFNQGCADVKIDRWHGITDGRPFPEKGWLAKMYLAHDLVAITGSAAAAVRPEMYRLDLD
jgi:hypothetical protein